MIHVEYQVLFWLFDPVLTLGFDLVACYLHLSCEFQVQVCISLIDVAPSFELDHLLLLANTRCFVGFEDNSLVFMAYVLHIGLSV
jgi:hypothetical protein